MANSSPAPLWLPDWKDPDAYAHLTVRHQLAWEFLRRNPEYQADWLNYESVPYYWPEGGKTPKGSGRSFAPWAEMFYYYADPPGLPNETLAQYERRLAGTDPKVTNLEAGLCEKWGILTLIAPEDADASRWLCPFENKFPLSNRSIEDVYVIHHHHMPDRYKIVPGGYLFDKYSPPQRMYVSIFPGDQEKTFNAEDPPNVVPIWFSLNHSLKAQIDAALIELKELRDELESTRTNRSAPSVATLIRALRVHDARLCGATHDEIQRTLDPLGNKNGTRPATDRDLKLANMMISAGYRKLIGVQ